MQTITEFRHIEHGYGISSRKSLFGFVVIIQPIVELSFRLVRRFDEVGSMWRTPYSLFILGLKVETVERTVQLTHINLLLPMCVGRSKELGLRVIPIKPIFIIKGGLSPCCPMDTKEQSQ